MFDDFFEGRLASWKPKTATADRGKLQIKISAGVDGIADETNPAVKNAVRNIHAGRYSKVKLRPGDLFVAEVEVQLEALSEENGAPAVVICAIEQARLENCELTYPGDENEPRIMLELTIEANDNEMLFFWHHLGSRLGITIQPAKGEQLPLQPKKKKAKKKAKVTVGPPPPVVT